MSDVTAPGRRVAARVAGALLLVFAVAIGLEATTFNVAFVTDAIGPKALPGLSALIMAIAGLSLLGRPDVDVHWPGRGPGLRMVGIAVAFLAYAAVLPWLGFFASTTGVVWTLSVLYGGPRLRAALAAVALSGVLWLVFVVLLDLALPVGELWML